MQLMNESRQSHAALITLLLMVGALVLYMLNAGNMVFMDPDEARYALIARNMVESGDWLVPRIPCSDEPYFDKPILFFWMLAGAFRLLSADEFTARLVSAVGAALVIGGTYLLGRVLLSSRAGIWAALFLLSTSLMVITGRFVRMDIWLTAFVVWGMLAFCRVHFANASRVYLIIGYACLAAACLTKGLIGILIPFAAIGGFLLFRRDWMAIRRSWLIPGMVLIVLLAGPWFAYMTWRFPGYPAEFFVKHHFARATTSTFGRSHNVLFLPGVILAGFVPWTIFLVAALWRVLPRTANADWTKPAGLVLCLWWAAVAVIPFMLSHTQLPVYIVPAFPPLALIAGWYVDSLLARNAQREAKNVFFVTLGLMALSLVALAVVNWFMLHDAQLMISARRLIFFIPAAMLIVWFLRRPRVVTALTTLLFMSLAMAVDAAWCIGPSMFAHFSAYQLVKAAGPQTADVDLLVMGPEPQYSVPFYLERRIEVDRVPHIIDFQKYAAHPDPMLGLLSGKQAFALVKGSTADRLKVLGYMRSLCLVKIQPRAPATSTGPSRSSPPDHRHAADKGS